MDKKKKNPDEVFSGLHTCPLWILSKAPLPLRPVNVPLKLCPLMNRPVTPKVSKLRFRSSAHVNLKLKKINKNTNSENLKFIFKKGKG